MATLYHNISGELSTEILAPGDRMNVSSISFANVNTYKHVLLDFFMKKPETGRYYLLKNVKIPAGASYVYDTIVNNRVGEFGLYIKLKAADTFTLTGSIDPIADQTVTGVGTLFLTELTVGDEIVVSGETRIVESITNNTSLEVTVAFSNNGDDTSPDCNPTALVDVIIS